MEEQIKMAAKLYKMRDACKFIWGGEYDERIKQWIEIVKMAMNKYRLDELHSAMQLAVDEKFSGDYVLRLFAAVVELIEPSK